MKIGDIIKHIYQIDFKPNMFKIVDVLQYNEQIECINVKTKSVHYFHIPLCAKLSDEDVAEYIAGKILNWK